MAAGNIGFNGGLKDPGSIAAGADIFYYPQRSVRRSKAWLCGRSPAEIVGSNPAGDMDVCLL